MFSPIEYLMMFGSSFALVFLLGIQSRNVIQGRYFAAALTSFGISVGNFVFVKYTATGSLSAFFVCAVAGCLGITTSIWAHKRIYKDKK